MTSRSILFILFAVSSLLLAEPASATGPKPAHRAPAARPAAPAPAAPTAAAPKPEIAPHTVYLSGTIVGADGQPRPGACVFPTTNRRLIAVADAKGAFRLQLPAGTGPLQVQAEYFGIGSQRIQIDGEHPQPVSIVLGQ